MSVAALVEGLSISSAGKGSMTQSLLADQLSAAFVVHAHLMSSALKANGAADPAMAPAVLNEMGQDMSRYWYSEFSPTVADAFRLSASDLDEGFVNAVAGKYTGALAQQVNEISDRAFLEGYNAALNKGWDRAVAWQRVADAYGLDPVQMRSWITAIPEQQGYATEITPEQAIRRRDELLLRRATRLGEHEVRTLRHTGRQTMWLQMMQQGNLPPNTMKKWVTAADERVCPECGPLDGKMEPLEGRFNGSYMPPLHINCRCEVILVDPSGESAVIKSHIRKSLITEISKARGDDKYDRDRSGKFSASESRGGPKGGTIKGRESIDDTLKRSQELAKEPPVFVEGFGELDDSNSSPEQRQVLRTANSGPAMMQVLNELDPSWQQKLQESRGINYKSKTQDVDQDGTSLAALKAEREKAAKEIGVAAEWGDLRENAEWHSARERAEQLDVKIAQLEAKSATTDAKPMSLSQEERDEYERMNLRTGPLSEDEAVAIAAAGASMSGDESERFKATLPAPERFHENTKSDEEISRLVQRQREDHGFRHRDERRGNTMYAEQTEREKQVADRGRRMAWDVVLGSPRALGADADREQGDDFLTPRRGGGRDEDIEQPVAEERVVDEFDFLAPQEDEDFDSLPYREPVALFESLPDAQSARDYLYAQIAIASEQQGQENVESVLANEQIDDDAEAMEIDRDIQEQLPDVKELTQFQSALDDLMVDARNKEALKQISDVEIAQTPSATLSQRQQTVVRRAQRREFERRLSDLERRLQVQVDDANQIVEVTDVQEEYDGLAQVYAPDGSWRMVSLNTGESIDVLPLIGGEMEDNVEGGLEQERHDQNMDELERTSNTGEQVRDPRTGEIRTAEPGDRPNFRPSLSEKVGQHPLPASGVLDEIIESAKTEGAEDVMPRQRWDDEESVERLSGDVVEGKKAPTDTRELMDEAPGTDRPTTQERIDEIRERQEERRKAMWDPKLQRLPEASPEAMEDRRRRVAERREEWEERAGDGQTGRLPGTPADDPNYASVFGDNIVQVPRTTPLPFGLRGTARGVMPVASSKDPTKDKYGDPMPDMVLPAYSEQRLQYLLGAGDQPSRDATAAMGREPIVMDGPQLKYLNSLERQRTEELAKPEPDRDTVIELSEAIDTIHRNARGDFSKRMSPFGVRH